MLGYLHSMLESAYGLLCQLHPLYRGEKAMITRFLVFLIASFLVFVLLVSCGSDGAQEQIETMEEVGALDVRRSTLEEAAERAFEVSADTPYRNPQFSIIENDGTFASVVIDVELREAAESPWTPNNATVECSRIGDLWECDTDITFSPSLQATVTAIPPQSATEPTETPTGATEVAAQEPTIVPSPTAAPDPIAFYVQNVETGAEARNRVDELFRYDTIYYSLDPDEGWQWLTFDIIYENRTGSPLRLGGRRIYGNVVDSGGYEHNASAPIPEGALLMPGVRYRRPFNVQIPQNQSPSRFEFSLGGIRAWVDLTSPDDDLAVPFDQPPAGIPEAPDILEFTMSGSFRVQISEFQVIPNKFSETVHNIECTVSIENLGGHDLTYLSDDQVPQFWGVTNHGMLVSGGVDLLEDIPPGFTKEGLCRMWGSGGAGPATQLHRPGGDQWTDFDWVWLAYMPPPYTAPVYQLIVASAAATNVPEITGASGSTPDESGRKIAFAYQLQDQNPDIYVYELDTQRLVRLTRSDSRDVSPSWSPDGQWIAFTSNRSGNPDIYIVRSDGTEIKQLTQHAAADLSPTWSPSGQEIAFMSYTTEEGTQSPNAAVYIVNIDGTGLRRLTDNTSDDTMPAWSPNNQWIAFQSDRGGARNIHLASILDGETDAIPRSPGNSTSFAWSPDSTQIVFSGSILDPISALYILDLNSPQVTATFTTTEFLVTSVDWSPRENLIAFVGLQRLDSGESLARIYTITPQGEEKTPIFESELGELIFGVSWSP